MTLAFFGSPPDLAIIFVIALVIFGPKKLPEVGRQIGQAMREFRKLADEVTGAAHSVQDEVKSVYTPILNPPPVSHATSSPTVERAVTHQPFDQEPEHLMAPAVPAAEASAPPSESRSEDVTVKGH